MHSGSHVAPLFLLMPGSPLQLVSVLRWPRPCRGEREVTGGNSSGGGVVREESVLKLFDVV